MKRRILELLAMAGSVGLLIGLMTWDWRFGLLSFTAMFLLLAGSLAGDD